MCLNTCACSGVWWFFLGKGRGGFCCCILDFFLFSRYHFCLNWRVFSINADSYKEILQADKKYYCFQIIVLPLGKRLQICFSIILYIELDAAVSQISAKPALRWRLIYYSHAIQGVFNKYTDKAAFTSVAFVSPETVAF